MQAFDNILRDFRNLFKRTSQPTAQVSTATKPNFLGIGVAKSATTSLAAVLKTHPQISMASSGKEVHFFDHEEKMAELGVQGYFDLFEPNVAVGEITPSYIFVPECRDRIYDILGPDIRFLVILRNPVNRAFSHYCHAINNWGEEKYRPLGYPIENLSFKEAILAEDERLASGRYHIRHQSYFSKGLYAKQLRWYFDRFPRENFHITIFEEYIQAQEAEIENIYRFLGVDPYFKAPNPKIRLNAQTKQELEPDIYAWLYARYETTIAELEALIGRNLDLWKMP